MNIDADKLASCLQPLAEMARALGAATVEKMSDYSRCISEMERRVKCGEGWHGAYGSNGTHATGDTVQMDHDLESLVAACAALADLHASDWMRVRAIERRIARRPDESGKLIHNLFATGAVQIVIAQTDKQGEFRIIVPTRRVGLHEAKADGLDEALRRAHNAIDVAR